jgi:hypothetical protein
MADIEVGAEYAHREGDSGQVSRVLVRKKLGGGRLSVKILETAVGAGKSFRCGALVEVTSRSLVCAWTLWPELDAAEQAARDEAEARSRERRAAFEREGIADADRLVPDKYDSRYYTSLVDSVADLRDWPIPSPRRGWRMDRERLVSSALTVLEGLPVYLTRDLLAAAELDADDSVPVAERSGGSVGAALGPLAPVLVDAMEWQDRGYLARRIPADLLSAANDFVDACARTFAEQGGRLNVPETPPLERTSFSGPGWMRVRYGHSSGRRIHAPDCHVLKSNMTDPNQAPTWPAWRLNLPGSDPCGNCGGPWVAASPALVGFLSAIAVWQHRSTKTVERWQLRACLTMLADAAQARAIEIEPDMDWVGRIVTALVADQPGEQGWDAYKALLPLGGDFRKWAKARQLGALRLAYNRLLILNDALPSSVRPGDQPSPVDKLPGAPEQRRQAVQSWYHDLTRICVEELTDLDLLLFGLPGAVKPW